MDAFETIAVTQQREAGGDQRRVSMILKEKVKEKGAGRALSWLCSYWAFPAYFNDNNKPLIHLTSYVSLSYHDGKNRKRKETRELCAPIGSEIEEEELHWRGGRERRCRRSRGVGHVGSRGQTELHLRVDLCR